MAPTWSSLVLAVVVSVAAAQSSSSSSAGGGNGGGNGNGAQMGVLAYPAGEGRISPTCFTRGSSDPFTCGWYCAHAFFVETNPAGKVTMTPFGKGNNADNAYCSDCSLFQGSGESPDLNTAGSMATGYLDGGYKWTAYYDAPNEEMIVNFTDYEEPCEIRYIVTEGEVMGVSAATGRPATANTQATLVKSGWGGPRVVCEATLAGCMNWDVYVEGDVADWQSLDEEATSEVCPSRVTVYGLSNGEYMGHDGTPRGVDSWSEDGQVVSDRNTIISWSSPFNLTRCELYFDVVEGCWNGVGPACSGSAARQHQNSLPTLAERAAKAKKDLAKKQRKHQHVGARAAGRLPMRKPRDVSTSSWNAAMPHADDFAPQAAGSSSSWLPSTSLAGWLVAGAVVAWLARRRCQGGNGYKAVPTHESSPLLV